MDKFPFAGGREERSIITVGNLIRRKGHRYLLAAMETVVSEFPDVTLHVVGTGPLREELESQTESLGIDDSVMFHGFVDDERLVELLQRARAFVHPSLSEGFSHARLEAMATGCPVVGTDVSGAHDLTRDGTDGYIVPIGNPDALADAIIELLSDAERASEMGRNARKKIERDHDYADIGRRYLEIYREMVA
jgi:glycosyltransferase involved in cell wall biosynthesis